MCAVLRAILIPKFQNEALLTSGQRTLELCFAGFLEDQNSMCFVRWHSASLPLPPSALKGQLLAFYE